MWEPQEVVIHDLLQRDVRYVAEPTPVISKGGTSLGSRQSDSLGIGKMYDLRIGISDICCYLWTPCP